MISISIISRYYGTRWTFSLPECYEWWSDLLALGCTGGNVSKFYGCNTDLMSWKDTGDLGDLMPGTQESILLSFLEDFDVFIF